MAAEELNSKTWHDSNAQSWYHERLYNLEGARLKVSIRVNAYDFQSYARIQKFDGTKWQPLADIMHSLWPADAKAVCYITQDVPACTFTKLVHALLDEAQMILGV